MSPLHNPMPRLPRVSPPAPALIDPAQALQRIRSAIAAGLQLGWQTIPTTPCLRLVSWDGSRGDAGWDSLYIAGSRDAARAMDAHIEPQHIAPGQSLSAILTPPPVGPGHVIILTESAMRHRARRSIERERYHA